MFIFKFILCILLILLLNCNISYSVNPTPTGNIARPDTNGLISSKLGDTIELKILNTAFDGGYTWNIISNFDSSKAKYITHKTKYTGTRGIDGAPMYEIWNFYALNEGNTTLLMKLFRVFEPKDIISSKIYQLTILK
ncbi:MAG: Chagasin family peptidase inhibitor [Ignavibacteria bacterium]|nr:Chagasin family peptidase inhibitor [Ignavibacteria bacterium]